MTEAALSGARLFGLPHSYYTAIARSYLRRNFPGVTEVSSRHPDFVVKIYPQIKRGIIPVLELADGSVVQDSFDIIEFSEKFAPADPALPEAIPLKFLAYIFFIYGSQALLKPAMHYRWSYYEQQKSFLDHAFSVSDSDPDSGRVMQKMSGYLPVLGVTEATIPVIEKAYRTLLLRLNRHLEIYPYILGSVPTLADYGMFGPLFAHLGRDPVPETIMKEIAPNVFRWTERMHSGCDDGVEYMSDVPEIAHTALPDTLMDLLSFIGDDYGNELNDRLSYIRQFLKTAKPDSGQPVSDKPSQRAIGLAEVRYGEGRVQVAIQPYLLYLQRRIESSVSEMTADERQWALSLVSQIGLEGLVEPRLSHTVDRVNNLEVWRKL